MAEVKHIIEPERLGLWTAVTFILALLALIVSMVWLRSFEFGQVDRFVVIGRHQAGM